MSNPSNGGSFLPAGDYAPTGDWDFSDATVTLPGGTVEDRGSIALTDTTNQVATGTGSNITTSSYPASSGAVTLTFPSTTTTIVGTDTTNTLTNKTLTAPAISAPVLSGSATGTYTLAGTPTITAPTITSPAITGTSTIGNGMTITTPVLSGTVTGTYTLGGTPTLASAAGVPYIAGVAAGYKIARSPSPVAVTGTSDVTTGLTTVLAAVACSEADFDGTNLASVQAVVTGGAGHILLKCWKITAADNGALVAASVAKNVSWIAIGT